MKIAVVASEAAPFSKTGGLGDVAGALPLALERLGHEVRLIIPKYRGISKRSATLGKAIAVDFIEHDGYFGREHLYGSPNGDYADNLDRFSFFSWRALEQLKGVRFKPDVIHVHDWQTALVPVYLSTTYRHDPFFQEAMTLLTIHNLSYQGIFPKSEFPKLGVPWELFHMEGLEYYDRINLLKGGLLFARRLNTVSPAYAQEIQTPEYGCGLDGVLRKRSQDLTGILNGIDGAAWDPSTDKALAANYSADRMEKRMLNKRALQTEMNLPVQPAAPLLGWVSRLVPQKGVDGLVAVAEALVRLGGQLVVLGMGDRVYHDQLLMLSRKYPNSIRLRLSFEDSLARQVYAGSDFFLMPSRFEPCGLGQMIAMRYGSIPIVRKTGGLADTVTDAGDPSGNGIVFEMPDPASFLAAIRRGFALFSNKKSFAALQRRAMKMDWSWERAARAYAQLYAPAGVRAR
ncbi:MAG: glycogen synthase GlgA [Candidatus Omnitrophica bacterium]|nr:glycogen synthase GlgA [Candidatus Omnitrophota bacterium]